VSAGFISDAPLAACRTCELDAIRHVVDVPGGERKAGARWFLLERRRDTMAMVFIGGSRDIVDLPEPAIERISSIVSHEHGVLIGDAPGADAEVQGVLAGYGYEHVGVFHAGKEPRHNLGDWAAYHVPRLPAPEAVHAAKDREMARRADYGLMIWDGASPGTFLNVLRLALAGSPCVVYDAMRGRVVTTHNIADWRAMLEHVATDVARQVIARMTPDEREALAARR
jgi:hypothetical protein